LVVALAEQSLPPRDELFSEGPKLRTKKNKKNNTKNAVNSVESGCVGLVVRCRQSMEGSRRSKRRAAQVAAQVLHRTISDDFGKGKKRRASAGDAEADLSNQRKRKRAGEKKATYSSGDFVAVRYLSLSLVHQ